MKIMEKVKAWIKHDWAHSPATPSCEGEEEEKYSYKICLQNNDKWILYVNLHSMRVRSKQNLDVNLNNESPIMRELANINIIRLFYLSISLFVFIMQRHNNYLFILILNFLNNWYCNRIINLNIILNFCYCF